MSSHPSATDMGTRKVSPTFGAIALISGFAIWGIPVPWIFFELKDVSAIELICYRTLLGSVFCALGLFFVPNGWLEARKAFESPQATWRAVLGGSLIGVNWLIFVWAIANGRTLESAIGYYMSPLIMVVGGILLKGEQLTRLTGTALTLTALGVGTIFWTFETFPWVSVSLAATFGYYGILKKDSPIGALPSLFAETTCLAPLAIGYLIYIGNPAVLFGSSYEMLLIVLCGFLTAVPLYLFGFGVAALTLTTSGLLQFLVPTLQFFSGVVLFGEPFDSARLLTFALIWSGVGLYGVQLLQKRRG